MNGRKLVKRRYAILRQACALCTAEVAKGLGAYFQRPIILKPNFEVRLQFLIWKSLSLRHHMSVSEAVYILCDYYSVFQPKVISKHVTPATSPIAYKDLTGKRAWNAMEKAVAWRYPNDEHIDIRKLQQRSTLIQIEPGQITYNELKDFVADYRQRIHEVRKQDTYRSNKPFRFSPWK